MPIAFDTSTDEQMADGGSSIAQPGWYHFQITHTDEQPVSKGSSASIDGFKIEVSSLAGPEVDKSLDIIFFNPKMSSKDGGDFARRKQTAFLEAAGLISPSQRGASVTIDLADAINRQVVAELELGLPNDKGRQFPQLAFANIYHIDDPRGAKCKKNEEALKLIPAAHRRDPASFVTKKADGGGAASGGAANGSGAAGNGATATKQPASTVSDDLGDL